MFLVCCPTHLCFRQSSDPQGDPPEQRISATTLELTSDQPKEERKPQKSNTERFKGKYTVTLNEPGSERSKILYSPANRLHRQQRHWTQVDNSTFDTLKQVKEEAGDKF